MRTRTGYPTGQSRTGVRMNARRVNIGLWPMVEPPGSKFKWGILLRKSKATIVTTPDGSKVQFEGSTDRQEWELVHHVEANKMGEIVDIYKDIASGWKPGARRKRFKDALADLEAGRIHGIAVLNIDRLTRQIGQVRPILNALQAMGGRLFSLEDELDTADVGDPEHPTELRLMELVAKAEREARRTSERWKLVHKHRVIKGLPHRGGLRPFGHTDSTYEAVVPEEVELIDEAAKAIVAGKETCFSIARLWTKKEVPTSSGGPWHHCTVYNILTSPRMVAKQRYGDALHDLPEAVPILSDELWEQVCAKLARNPNRRRQGRAESYEGTGIALCGICGLPLASSRERVSSGDYEPAYCCKKRPNVPGACGGVNVRVRLFDDVLDSELVAFINDHARVQAALDAYRLPTPDLEAIDERFAELEADKRRLQKAFFRPPKGQPRLSEEFYYEQLQEIAAEVEALDHRRQINREAEPLRALLRRETPWTIEEWRNEPLGWRRRIIQLVTERIEVAKSPTRGGSLKGTTGGHFDRERVRIKFIG